MNNFSRLNIVLIGFMGCGKTTVGKKLSAYLRRRFYDSDSIIEKQSGLAIPQIFENIGEPYFRELEMSAIRNLAEKQSTVIATGGGVVKNLSNMENLRRNGLVFYLKSTPEKIYANIKNDNSRPLLNTGNKFKSICHALNERESLYNQYSHCVLDISCFTPEESTKKIVDILDKHIY